MKFRIVQILPNRYELKYQVQEEYDKPSYELDPTTYKPVSYSKDWRPLLMYIKSHAYESAKQVPAEYTSVEGCDAIIDLRIAQLKKLKELKTFEPIIIQEYEY